MALLCGTSQLGGDRAMWRVPAGRHLRPHRLLSLKKPRIQTGSDHISLSISRSDHELWAELSPRIALRGGKSGLRLDGESWPRTWSLCGRSWVFLFSDNLQHPILIIETLRTGPFSALYQPANASPTGPRRDAPKRWITYSRHGRRAKSGQWLRRGRN
jgi:hypothetical protein